MLTSVVTNDAVARYEGGRTNVSAPAATMVPAATATTCRQRVRPPATSDAKLSASEGIGAARCGLFAAVVKAARIGYRASWFGRSGCTTGRGGGRRLEGLRRTSSDGSL